jgi:hypothetical protein
MEECRELTSGTYYSMMEGMMQLQVLRDKKKPPPKRGRNY